MMKFLLSAALVGGAAAACSDYSNVEFHYTPSVAGSQGLCGASWCPNPSAPETRTYWRAGVECAEAGMRVPTLYELTRGAASGTGCGSDAEFVWSSTPCDGGQEVFRWSDKSTVCTTDDGTNLNVGRRVLVRCAVRDTESPTAAPTSFPTAAPTFYESLSAALKIPSNEAAISFVAGKGADGTTIYMCSRDSQLCFKNLAGARHAFELVSDDSEHADATPFEVSETSGDGTWTVTPAGLDFAADAGASFSFPAECSCASGGGELP